MTSEKQFEAFWKVGYKQAILEIIRNRGRVLSKRQLERLLTASIKQGSVSYVLALADLGGMDIKPSQMEELIEQCLKHGWVADALYAARHAGLPPKCRRILIEACVTNGFATTSRKAERLLRSDL